VEVKGGEVMAGHDGPAGHRSGLEMYRWERDVAGKANMERLDVKLIGQREDMVNK